MTRMERGVVQPLDIPAWQPKTVETQETATETHETSAAVPVTAARASIEDFLNMAPRTASGPRPEAAGAPLLAEDRCPHCSSRLSSIDLKFNRCLCCGKPPVQATSVESDKVKSESWTVHL